MLYWRPLRLRDISLDTSPRVEHTIPSMCDAAWREKDHQRIRYGGIGESRIRLPASKRRRGLPRACVDFIPDFGARPKESRGREHAPDPTVETWLLSCLFFYGVQAAYSVTLGIGAGCAFLLRSGVQ